MVTTGVVFNVIVNRLTAYFTATEKAPVQEIAKSDSLWPRDHHLERPGRRLRVQRLVRRFDRGAIMVSVLVYGPQGSHYVIYGVALIGIGWLTHAGNLVSMDSFGPISDNANGIGEMAEHGCEVAQDHDASWTPSATPPRPSPRASRSARQSSPRSRCSAPS